MPAVKTAWFVLKVVEGVLRIYVNSAGHLLENSTGPKRLSKTPSKNRIEKIGGMVISLYQSPSAEISSSHPLTLGFGYETIRINLVPRLVTGYFMAVSISLQFVVIECTVWDRFKMLSAQNIVLRRHVAFTIASILQAKLPGQQK
ncbi:hypothetical protein L486_02288 [Kwoniella mangroviensis CBS 10435]|uniref:Uncharacterized protein n=1 Tax=Kwoniella mangroviensis CBS 10435 TaxID=1331196 RepID=A0A1B9IVS1_9TREE|nr:hypothetical protein L486_02288 [Kwoniella mangroviensis CBS 10435]